MNDGTVRCATAGERRGLPPEKDHLTAKIGNQGVIWKHVDSAGK